MRGLQLYLPGISIVKIAIFCSYVTFFAVPPVAALSQSSFVISEGVTKYVQCSDSLSTQHTIVNWRWSGALNGVFQIGNYLAFNLADTSHAGVYQCHVFNAAGFSNILFTAFGKAVPKDTVNCRYLIWQKFSEEVPNCQHKYPTIYF